ncbi:hypothetical protein CEUSTIGMA_g1801.t1 [Chlamydomonas eustigma]|uniref:SCP domain-containing protein n=1 Tax=Chlamydomonas eustigma TaxID=1157962 RepID=A0A250WUN9_9CHLO|nr:hypothetical protein CEUSTIGMA_g1801.t1 [Chlamydomonas eustigma]|eukprot:GAX74352.1 hypothetical protein CEUSTIGMA_g1801.t1 [Chlamydomonas eustigma]
MYRALYGEVPLTWSTNMASWATKWAANCVFMHSPYPWGENLAIGYATASPGQVASEFYTYEVCSYNYSNPGFAENTGHFTQIIWASTTSVGCAITTSSTCPNGVLDPTSNHVYPSSSFYMLVCEYDPPGNVWGEYSMEVPPMTLPPLVLCSRT